MQNQCLLENRKIPSRTPRIMAKTAQVLPEGDPGTLTPHKPSLYGAALPRCASMLQFCTHLLVGGVHEDTPIEQCAVDVGDHTADIAQRVGLGQALHLVHVRLGGGIP